MALIDQIKDDLKLAMKERNEQTLSTLRMLQAALKNKAIELKRDLEEEEVLAVVKSQVKQLKDSLESFTEGAREDLAAKAREEIELLAKYSPKQMDFEELKKIVKETIAEVGAQGKQDMGKVMGAIMGKVKGKVDGGDVKKAVEEELGSDDQG